MNETAKKYIYPISREGFAYGEAEAEENGFVISDKCIGWAACAEARPAVAIDRLHP